MKSVDRLIVSAIIFSRDNKILMGQKPPHKADVYPGCWHIPGGGADPGESFENALRREIFEETGIDTSPYPVEPADNQGRGEGVRVLGGNEKVLAKMQFNVFRVRIHDKDAADIIVEEKDDLENLTWFSVDELANVKLTPPSIALFQRLGYIQ